MQNKKSKTRALLLCGLMLAQPVGAEIFIINTQTLDPEQLGTGRGHSLSDVEANRKVLLDYYRYSEQQAAVVGHQQSTRDLAYKIQLLSQSGADEQTLNEVNSQLKQLQQAVQAALPGLSKFELPEFRQLHRIEQENAAQLENLQQQVGKIPAAPPESQADIKR
ncbi:MAG: hypothetical protein Q4G28_07380 [Neisseria sp.]|nr:hypothetical protein [Neisseria sp.]